MTQADQNTPATATTSKRTTKAKTTTAKVATVLTSADAAVNQEKISSQAELQNEGQTPVADIELEQGTSKEIDDVKASLSTVEQPPLLDTAVNQEKTSLQGMQSDTAGQNLVADVEPEKSSSAEISASPVNKPVGTEQVLPEVQIPSPVKHVTAAKTGLFVVVKNTGVQTVFEPLSKTSIKSGETVEIRCSTGQFKHDVLNNLKQFIGLGKNLEIQNA